MIIPIKKAFPKQPSSPFTTAELMSNSCDSIHDQVRQDADICLLANTLVFGQALLTPV